MEPLSSRLPENYSQIIRVIDPDNKFRAEESISEFIPNDRRFDFAPRIIGGIWRENYLPCHRVLVNVAK